MSFQVNSCAASTVITEYDLTGCSASGGGFGDPHLKTWLRDTFDFHGECDLVLTRTPSFADGNGLEIQIRTEIRHDWSFITQTAIKVGNEVMEISGNGVYMVNGVQGDELKEKNQDLAEFAGFPVHYSRFGTRGRRHRFGIDLGVKGTIVVRSYNEFLAVGVEHADSQDFVDSVGLMGSFTTGELLNREGKLATSTIEFGMDWQVRDTEKNLFKDPSSVNYPELCLLPEANSIARRRC